MWILVVYRKVEQKGNFNGISYVLRLKSLIYKQKNLPDSMSSRSYFINFEINLKS